MSHGSIEFDPFSDTFLDDPSATYARLRDDAPVYFNEKYGFSALSRYADVVAAHGDPVRFVGSYGVTLELLLQKQSMNTNMMIVMDPPEHSKMRRLVSQAFSRNAIGSLQPLVAEVIAAYLDALADRSKFDLIEEFAALFPVEVISAILRVPEGERQQVRLWVDLFLHREVGNPNTTHEGMEATLHMAGYFLELTRATRRRPDILPMHPPSQYQGRFATVPVEFDGGVIPADSPVILLTGAATRDPRAYERPDTFDIERGGRTTLAFGYGVHGCLGAWLARLESNLAFEGIRARWPHFEVQHDGLRRVNMANVAGYSNVPVVVP